MDPIEAAHKRIDNLSKKVNRNRFILSFLFGYTFRSIADIPDWLITILKQIVLNL